MPGFVLRRKHALWLSRPNPEATLRLMNPRILNLFEFADFRKFLESYQEKRQALHKSFTRSQFCKELGLPNTRSYFNDIVNGKVLSKTYVERFIQVLRMDEDEAQYFRILVDFNQSVHDKEREILFDQLISLNRTPKKFIGPKEYEFYKQWHHTALFALLDIHDVGEDYADLGKKLRPSISPNQARASIQLLHKLGLIRRNEKGHWKATAKTLDAGPYVKDEMIKQYQLQCLELAKKNLLLEQSGVRNFSTVTLSISKNGCDLIERKLQKFKSEVRAIAHKETDPADRLYQLNIQYFSQSHPEKSP
jgi:uncharacterized protein (TIGR02147 family)